MLSGLFYFFYLSHIICSVLLVESAAVKVLWLSDIHVLWFKLLVEGGICSIWSICTDDPWENCYSQLGPSRTWYAKQINLREWRTDMVSIVSAICVFSKYSRSSRFAQNYFFQNCHQFWKKKKQINKIACRWVSMLFYLYYCLKSSTIMHFISYVLASMLCRHISCLTRYPFPAHCTQITLFILVRLNISQC